MPASVVAAVLFLTFVAQTSEATAARWLPAPTTAPWQWQLQGEIDTSVPADVYEVDGFDVPASVVRTLHDQGRHVICYINVGSWEDWRRDADDFPKSVLGKRYEGYPSERWLDIRRIGKLKPIMDARFAMCARKRFDAVEADNVNAFDIDSGFPLTRAHQLRFNRWVARRVHHYGMSVALKNDGPQAAQLVGDFDMAVVESCFRYHECGDYRVFIEQGKAVFATEYEVEPDEFCADAAEFGFSAIRKRPDLRAFPWRTCILQRRRLDHRR
jgi:hypothetical protein